MKFTSLYYSKEIPWINLVILKETHIYSSTKQIPKVNIPSRKRKNHFFMLLIFQFLVNKVPYYGQEINEDSLLIKNYST